MFNLEKNGEKEMKRKKWRKVKEKRKKGIFLSVTRIKFIFNVQSFA